MESFAVTRLLSPDQPCARWSPVMAMESGSSFEVNEGVDCRYADLRTGDTTAPRRPPSAP